MKVSYSILRQARPAPSPVNLAELAHVRQYHMPTEQVKWASLCEVERRAAEVARQHPHLQEEVEFVLLDEATRRARLADSSLTVNR